MFFPRSPPGLALCVPWVCVQGEDGAPSTWKSALYFPVLVLLCEEATEAGPESSGLCMPVISRV